MKKIIFKDYSKQFDDVEIESNQIKRAISYKDGSNETVITGFNKEATLKVEIVNKVYVKGYEGYIKIPFNFLEELNAFQKYFVGGTLTIYYEENKLKKRNKLLTKIMRRRNC